jgi:hypothetical protein
MRTILNTTLLALAITTVAAFGADNTLGTWTLNVAASKYTPAPMPVKSLTVTKEASDGGMKNATTGEQADGTAINASYTAKYDGKDVQVAGNAEYSIGGARVRKLGEGLSTPMAGTTDRMR